MKYQICHSNIWPDHHLLQKNPWEGRAYLETLHDLPGRLSDASSFSSERICSCQGGGFLQPSNYLNALPSIKKYVVGSGEKRQPLFLQSWLFSPRKKLYGMSHRETLLSLWLLCASHLRILVDVKVNERNLMKI